jgi:multidrug resistance efflux pump
MPVERDMSGKVTQPTAFGQVEETSRARGVLRAPFGVQPVVSLLTGTVRELLVEGGAHVEAGQLIARLDATPLQAQLQEVEQRLSGLESEWRRTRTVLDQRHRRRAQLMAARVELLAERRYRQGGKIARRQHARRLAAPELESLVEDAVRDQSVDALALVAAQSEHDARIEHGEASVQEARTRRDAVQLLLAQAELRAPQAGKLESLRAQPGLVVQQGEWIARVVSEQSPHTIVAFAPERDLAFLRAGATAHVQLDQLPIAEFGLAQATVSRVAGELADESELKAALGAAAPSGPHVRIELVLAEQPARVAALLRPGTLVSARIALRERRMLAIAFEPVRRWFL